MTHFKLVSLTFTHTLKDMYCLLAFPILCYGCPILYRHTYLFIIYCSYTCFYIILSVNLPSGLFISNLYYRFSFPSGIFPFLYILFSIWRRPYSICLRVGIILINSCIFCLSRCSLCLLVC